MTHRLTADYAQHCCNRTLTVQVILELGHSVYMKSVVYSSCSVLQYHLCLQEEASSY